VHRQKINKTLIISLFFDIFYSIAVIVLCE